MRLLLLSLLLVMQWDALAQERTGVVRLTVGNSRGEVLHGASIALKGTRYGGNTDARGELLITGIPAGTYILTASFVGHVPVTQDVSLSAGEQLSLTLTLPVATEELAGVEIRSGAEGAALKQSPQAVSVLEARSFYGQSVQTATLMNRVAGVRVRQEGGLGSNANFSINGISGKRIRFFLDGIPLSYLGPGLDLQALPINVIERIEVYKGVVPVDLGADALGGAIQIVTRQDAGSYLDGTYSAGSFRTHTGSLTARYTREKTGLFIGATGFVNASANNYPIQAEIPNAAGNPEPVRIRRFHDSFRSTLARLETGQQGKKWADYVSLSAYHSALAKDIQHNLVMSQPYGAATFAEAGQGLALTYRKANLLKNLDVHAFAAYNQRTSHFTDTSLNAYTWDGRVHSRRAAGGEISTSRHLLTFSSRNALVRLHAAYAVTAKSTLKLNYLITYATRVGNDPVAAAFYDQDPFVHPTTLRKNAAGIAYEWKAWQNRITGSSFLKYFDYYSQAFAIENLQYTPATATKRRVGGGQAFKYQVNSKLLVKLSYEYATRLPDEGELFGDFIFVPPNPTLLPETSHNGNAGLLYNGEGWGVELNGFYRFSDDLIWQRPSDRPIPFENLLKAQSLGAEAELYYKPVSSLKLTVNGTYQDIRNKAAKEYSGVTTNRYYNARLPNTPYLFANAGLQWQKENAGAQGNLLQAWWNGNHIHLFYLYWAKDGLASSKEIIPTQFIQDVGITYLFSKRTLTLSAEVHNLTGSRAFDNYRVQRPGRSFHLKLRAFFTKQS